MKALQEVIKRGKLITPDLFRQLRQSPEYAPRVVSLDASWFLPNNPRNAKKEYIQERIPGAVFFDIDAVKDENSPYPHMVPSVTEFNRNMSAMGLKRSDLLVVYDSVGNFSAPRAHWLLRVFQHPESLLLNNFPSYKKQGGVLSGGPLKDVDRPATDYQSPGLRESSVVLYEELEAAVKDENTRNSYYLVDARPLGRFKGVDPEPREGLPSGHIPGAISIPFSDMIRDGLFLPGEELSGLFQQRGVGTDKPVILMCGTGVTACVVEAGLREADYTTQEIRVYDGSWTEWAQRADPSLIVGENE